MSPLPAALSPISDHCSGHRSSHWYILATENITKGLFTLANTDAIVKTHWVCSTKFMRSQGRAMETEYIAAERQERSLIDVAPHGRIQPQQTEDHHEQPVKLATFDVLTGLYSRQAILDRLCELVNLAGLYKESFSVILLDIDHFKIVNERHGHLTGDRVLEQIATLIRGNIRKRDMAGRYGGEEIIIVLPGTTLASAWAAAERLRSLIERTELKDSAANVFAITVSQGLVGWEPDDDASSLLSRADEALHKAKEKGRNRVQIMLGPSLRGKI